MFVIVWEFEAEPRRAAEFQSIYSSQGDWAALFRQAPGYLGTELLQSTGNPARFLTLDRWTHPQDFANFQRDFAAPYAALDARCQSLTLRQRKLGAFTQAGPQ